MSDDVSGEKTPTTTTTGFDILLLKNPNKLQMKSVNTGSYFDGLRCESSVDVVDEHVSLLFCQIQAVQNRGIAASHKKHARSHIQLS